MVRNYRVCRSGDGEKTAGTGHDRVDSVLTVVAAGTLSATPTVPVVRDRKTGGNLPNLPAGIEMSRKYSVQKSVQAKRNREN